MWGSLVSALHTRHFSSQLADAAAAQGRQGIDCKVKADRWGCSGLWERVLYALCMWWSQQETTPGKSSDVKAFLMVLRLDVQEQGAGWCNFLRPFCDLQVTASHCVLSVFAWSASMCVGALFGSLSYENLSHC